MTAVQRKQGVCWGQTARERWEASEGRLDAGRGRPLQLTNLLAPRQSTGYGGVKKIEQALGNGRALARATPLDRPLITTLDAKRNRRARTSANKRHTPYPS